MSISKFECICFLLTSIFNTILSSFTNSINFIHSTEENVSLGYERALGVVIPPDVLAMIKKSFEFYPIKLTSPNRTEVGHTSVLFGLVEPDDNMKMKVFDFRGPLNAM